MSQVKRNKLFIWPFSDKTHCRHAYDSNIPLTLNLTYLSNLKIRLEAILNIVPEIIKQIHYAHGELTGINVSPK